MRGALAGTAILLALAGATARGQCPDGSPPPCNSGLLRLDSLALLVVPSVPADADASLRSDLLELARAMVANLTVGPLRAELVAVRTASDDAMLARLARDRNAGGALRLTLRRAGQSAELDARLVSRRGAVLVARSDRESTANLLSAADRLSVVLLRTWWRRLQSSAASQGLATDSIRAMRLFIAGVHSIGVGLDDVGTLEQAFAADSAFVAPAALIESLRLSGEVPQVRFWNPEWQLVMTTEDPSDKARLRALESMADASPTTDDAFVIHSLAIARSAVAGMRGRIVGGGRPGPATRRADITCAAIDEALWDLTLARVRTLAGTAGSDAILRHATNVSEACPTWRQASGPLAFIAADAGDSVAMRRGATRLGRPALADTLIDRRFGTPRPQWLVSNPADGMWGVDITTLRQLAAWHRVGPALEFYRLASERSALFRSIADVTGIVLLASAGRLDSARALVTRASHADSILGRPALMSQLELELDVLGLGSPDFVAGLVRDATLDRVASEVGSFMARRYGIEWDNLSAARSFTLTPPLLLPSRRVAQLAGTVLRRGDAALVAQLGGFLDSLAAIDSVRAGPVAATLRGEIALQGGDSVRAEREFVRAIELSAWNAPARARYRLGQLHAASGRYDHAEWYLRSLTSPNSYHDVEHLLYLGPALELEAETLARLGREREAADRLRELVQLWDHADAALQSRVTAARVRLRALTGGR